MKAEVDHKVHEGRIYTFLVASIKIFWSHTNTKRTYVYVLGCWSSDRSGAGRALEGRIYTSLAVGENWLGTQRVKPEEDHYKPIRICNAFSSDYI